MAQESPSREYPKFMVRLPGDLRDRIRQAAERRHTSMNSWIVASLERALELDESAAEARKASPGALLPLTLDVPFSWPEDTLDAIAEIRALAERMEQKLRVAAEEGVQGDDPKPPKVGSYRKRPGVRKASKREAG